MDYIEKQLIESEVKLTQAVYNSKNNLLEIINKINTDEFINKDMQRLFDYAVMLYQKYDFMVLDENRVKQAISLDETLEEYMREVLKVNVEVFMIDYKLDIKGEYEIYSKNLGLYKYKKFIEENGNFNGLMQKMNNLAENTEDIRNFLLNSIDTCFGQYKSKPMESDIEVGMDILLREIETNNMELGIKQLNSPYTNHFTGGIFKGVHYLGASSGVGKTTWSFPLYILPILLAKDTDGEMNEKLLIIANEQDKKTFQKLFLTAIYTYCYRVTKANSKLVDRFIRRHRLERGLATDLDKRLLKDTYEYYKEKFKKRVKFVFMPMFNPNDIEVCITSNARKGYTNVLLDTMKAEQKGEYQLLSNLATRLDMIAKANDLRIVATVQLAIHSMNRKYLDHTCLAESKQIVEIAEHSLYFRYTDLEELNNLTVKRFKKGYDEYGNYTGIDYEQIIPSELEAYYNQMIKKKKDEYLGSKFMLVFVGKNRHGESNKIILVLINFDNMIYREIGVVEGLKYDNKF